MGASFIEMTVIVTVAVLLSTVPSLTLNVNESRPLKFMSGVYVAMLLLMMILPSDGSETM